MLAFSSQTSDRDGTGSSPPRALSMESRCYRVRWEGPSIIPSVHPFSVAHPDPRGSSLGRDTQTSLFGPSPPALLVGRWGIPKSAKRHKLSSVSWVYPGSSSNQEASQSDARTTSTRSFWCGVCIWHWKEPDEEIIRCCKFALCSLLFRLFYFIFFTFVWICMLHLPLTLLLEHVNFPSEGKKGDF